MQEIKTKQFFLKKKKYEIQFFFSIPFHLKQIIHTGHAGSSLSIQIIHLKISAHQTL